MKEKWKIIKNFSNYAVSNLGQVKRIFGGQGAISNKILKLQKDGCGYVFVGLFKDKKRKFVKVHRLVLQAFYPNYNKDLECNHKDGNKANNRIENLEMVTHSKNQKHAYRKGLQIPKKGEEKYNAKLGKEDIILIRKIVLLKRKEKIKDTFKQIGKMFNVSDSTISDIVSGRTWTHII